MNLDRKQTLRFVGFCYSLNLHKITVYSSKEVILSQISANTDWTETSVSGCWTQDLSGGCANFDTWRSNPAYLVHFSAPANGSGEIAIILSPINSHPVVGLYLFSSWSVEGQPIAYTSEFTDYGSLEAVLPFNPGTYYIVPTTYHRGFTGNFSLTIYSATPGIRLDPTPRPFYTLKDQGP